MAYQFVHMEAYARKADKGGRSVAWVLDEAERKPGACVHVDNPQPPKVVYGLTPAEVRVLHDEACATVKTKLANGRERAVRVDQKTLLTVVASHPATTSEMSADQKVAADVERWERLTVDWLKSRYGDELVSVVRHEDESHPHLHAYILPKDLRALALHPGAEAKKRVQEAGPEPGEDSKALNRRGDAAYKAAMRDWQDEYWRHVGMPCGLARLGPGKRRLSRAEWQAEKKAAAALKEVTEKARLVVKKTKVKASAMTTEAQRQVDEARRLREEAERRAAAAKQMHDAAVARERVAAQKARKAKVMVMMARRQASQILAGAKTEAAKVKSIGGRLRTLVDGFRRSAIRAEIQREALKEIAAERRQAAEARRRASEERRLREKAEERADNLLASARDLGAQLEALRARLPAAPARQPARRLSR